MPIYEYMCAKCHNTSEILQKINDKPLSRCPLCGGRAKRLMSRNSFQLKGDGWYVTEYKDKKAPDAGNAAEKASDAKASDPAPAPVSAPPAASAEPSVSAGDG